MSRLPFADRLFPGAAVTRAEVEPYAAQWIASNARDAERDGPLWVLFGDSTGQGIGASAFDRGYAGQLRQLLESSTGRAWRILNLSRSGDRAADVLHNQLPVVRRLADPPELVTCVIGGNDAFKTPTGRLRRSFEAIAQGLPHRAVIGNLPSGFRSRRFNPYIAELAARFGLRVADIERATQSPWQGKYAVDNFHPNDLGYADWANALADAIGLRDRVRPAP
jgi:lysophospholipase L1-like esterase